MMIGSTLGLLIVALLSLALSIFMLRLIINIFISIFSNTFVKIITILIIAYCDYALLNEFKTSHDINVLVAIFGSIIFGIIVLSIKSTSSYSGGGHYSYDSDDTASTITKNEPQSKNVCPKCGCEFQYIPEQVVPTGEYNDYEGKGYWEYYTEDGMTKSKWVTPMHHDPVYQKIGGYYQCPSCGRRK